MPFSCTCSKTKDDLHRNVQPEEQIEKSSSDNIQLNNINLTDEDIAIISQKVIRKKKVTSLSLSNNQITSNGIKILLHSLKTNKK
jgi:hypothetical protein